MIIWGLEVGQEDRLTKGTRWCFGGVGYHHHDYLNCEDGFAGGGVAQTISRGNVKYERLILSHLIPVKLF